MHGASTSILVRSSARWEGETTKRGKNPCASGQVNPHSHKKADCVKARSGQKLASQSEGGGSGWGTRFTDPWEKPITSEESRICTVTYQTKDDSDAIDKIVIEKKSTLEARNKLTPIVTSLISWMRGTL